MAGLINRITLTLSSWVLAIILVVAILIYGPGILIFHAKIPRARASALSFICASSASSTSTGSCTGEQSGDLLLVTATIHNGSTAPSTSTGFTSVTTVTNSGGSASTRTAMNTSWSTASSSSSGSGTWSGATEVIMQVYRGANIISPIGNFATQGGNNSANSVVYAADNLSVTDGSSWFAAFAVRNSADTNLNSSPPFGMSKRASIPTTPFAAGYDQNGPTATNWSVVTVNGFSASSKYTSIVLELKAAPNITVGATGSATASMTIPSTSNYTGGAFSFIRDVGSTNVTSITITETGSVNANANLSNLILFYKQEASCSTSIPSGTTQFNSTAGSFGVGDISTVTGTMNVGTSQVCVYAQVDVGSGASSGDTLDLSINNPSSDVTVASGAVSPITSVSNSGSTTLSPPGPTTDQILRGGEWFSGGSKQPFFWTN